MLLNKKQALIELYEQERGQGGDKVAQMLSQDFTQQRWKTAAAKNALVLRQKQRYLLSATFFILANDLHGALEIVKESMKDPILAVLVCRMLMLQQPTNAQLQTFLDAIYDEHFIQRGKEFNDNYLISLGHWGKKEYIQAVNCLQTEAAEANFSEGVKHLFERENVFDLQATLARASKKPKADDALPLVTLYAGFELPAAIVILRRAPRVVDALKGSNSATGYGADDGDIFADFDAPSTSKKAAAKAVQEKVELKIDQTVLLQQMLSGFVAKKDLFSCLFLIRENRAHIKTSNKLLVEVLQQVIDEVILNQILQTRVNESYLFQHGGSLCSQIDKLVDFVLEGNSGGNQEELKVVKTTLRREA